MKWLICILTFAFLILATPRAMAASCRNDAGTCIQATGTTGEGCKSPGVVPKACFINVAGVGCYRIYNSTGKDLFVPTKTVGEFNQFLSNVPAGITQAADVYCSPP